MDIISFEDFKKLEIRIGKIISAEKMEGSEKLLKLEVDFSPDASKAGSARLPVSGEKRQILSGIAQFYTPEQLIGKLCPFVVNLAPKAIMELESHGMILCADDNGPVLLHPDKEISPGSVVK